MSHDEFTTTRTARPAMQRRCYSGCGRVATVVSRSRSLCSACYTRLRTREAKRVS
jgi:hypothetical protein